MKSLSANLVASKDRHPDRVALRCDELRLSFAEFEKAFGCLILKGYGLSESSPVASVPQGQAGEVQIRGHNVMKGYWNLPEATKATITADGWLCTGDVGRVDEDGYFYIVDRTKDMIAEAAVIGIPHDPNQ